MSLENKRGRCQFNGCASPAGGFGYCLTHEPEFVAQAFSKYTAGGAASREKPTCYETQQKWMQYVVAYIFCSAPDRRDGVTVEHCRDCTPKFRDEQIALGRCQQPETVFIRPEGKDALIGVPLLDMGSQSKVQRWEKAVMGMSGSVVSLPRPEILSKIIETLAIRRARHAGRPKKGETE